MCVCYRKPIAKVTKTKPKSSARRTAEQKKALILTKIFKNPSPPQTENIQSNLVIKSTRQSLRKLSTDIVDEKKVQILKKVFKKSKLSPKSAQMKFEAPQSTQMKSELSASCQVKLNVPQSTEIRSNILKSTKPKFEVPQMEWNLKDHPSWEILFNMLQSKSEISVTNHMLDDQTLKIRTSRYENEWQQIETDLFGESPSRR